ncbi:hypothetical protein MMC29_005569, partial [Sticta canariensis]|nr:hypothetical protein [Sticta canariensis]
MARVNMAPPPRNRMIPSFGTHPKPRATLAGKGVKGGKVGSGGKGMGKGIGVMKRHR